MIKKIEAVQDFLLNLVSPAENVRIILLKSADSCESSKCTTELISMQNSKVCNPDRKLLVGVSLALEDQAVDGAVHRLQSLCLNPVTILVLEEVHMLLVVLVVSRDLP